MMIKISILGDLVPLVSKNFNADPFEDVKELLTGCDLVIANLESPIIMTESPSEKYGPHLSVREDQVLNLKAVPIEVVTLANNHIMDHVEEGLYNTFSYLDTVGIKYFGAGASLEKAREPYVFEKDTEKIYFLNFAENEFSNTYGTYPGANPVDVIDNITDIRQAKSHSEYVICIVHGGSETHEYPSPYFVKYLRALIDAGADAVVAHHTHMYNGWEKYKKEPIVYGVGNFFFRYGHNADFNWSLGALAKLCIETETKNVNLEIVPFLQNYSNNSILSYFVKF